MSGICDLCAAPLGERAVEITPSEMRVIARNGYGEHVKFGSRLAPSQLRDRLIDLALHDSTAWAVCASCYAATRSYAVDRGTPGAPVRPPVGPSSSGRILLGHTERLMGVAMTPDGRSGLSAGWDKTVRLWDLDSGTELHCYKGHSEFVTSVAFLGEGARAISAGADAVVRIWDCASGRTLFELRKHSFTIHKLAVSGNGRIALTVSGDRSARIWDVEKGVHLRKLGGFFGGSHGDAVTAGALSRDGTRALTGSLGMEVRYWDVTTGALLQSFKGFPYGINDLAFLPDERTAIAVPGKDPHVLDLRAGRDTGAFATDAKSWDSLAISANGSRLAVADGWNGAFVRILEPSTGREIQRYTGHTKMIQSVAISANGRRVLSGSDDWTVRVWD